MSRPTKKRALMPSSDAEVSSMSPTPVASAVRRYDANLDSIYKAELEHEQSLRSLDAKRALQREQRLEKLVEFSQDELEQCKAMLEEERHESELHMIQLRQARDEAIQQLRELQRRRSSSLRHQQVYHHDGDRSGDDGGEQDSSSLWRRKVSLLETQVAAKNGELEKVRLQLRELQTQVVEKLEEKKKTAELPTPPDSKSVLQGSSSSAPSDLLHELNRVRIELAESERKQRQIRRAAEDWQKKAKQLVPEREAARALQVRVHKLEGQLKEIQKSHQLALAENEEWQSFGKTLSQHFPCPRESSRARSTTTPPEVTTILRHVEEATIKLVEVQDANKSLEERLEKIRDWKRPTEARMNSYDEKEAAWKEERKDLQQQLEQQQRQLETLQKQEDIWKREIASLQELLQTYDSLPISKTAPSLPMASTDARLQTVELELKSTHEELEVVKADRDRMQQELANVVQVRQEQRQELDRVKEKYGKLREALEVQRGKAQEAEARAHRAEELAGMGSFNPHETQVLHLSQNPLSESLRQQNANLKKQLQEALQRKGSAGAAPTSNTTATNPQLEVDPDKLHQRLKESFKEQIGLFREGVHLMTGYKIDMLPGVDRPTFRVRSLFAANENDHLMLKWPKLPEGEAATSLDLLGTEWAKVLAQSPSYDYMTRFHSLPAFLASVQLSEFEKQTIMG